MNESSVSINKKQAISFWGISIGIPVILGILMWLVFQSGNSTGIFPVAWMFLPASGVMVGQLLMKKEDPDRPALPKAFIITFLVTTIVMILCCLLPLFMDGQTVVNIGNAIFMVASILSFILLLAATKKETRKAYGLSMPNLVPGIFIVLLFIVLCFVHIVFSGVLSSLVAGNISEYFNAENWQLSSSNIITLVLLPISMFLAFLPYFGEEYGWRYYLQPILQKKFGKKLGVVLLGVIWGLWHLPINMFFYSPDTALQSIILQVVACIAFAVFFGWAYAKTDGNIWVCVAIHFFNNNLGAALTGADGSGNQYAWSTVAIGAVSYLAIMALPFIFTKVYSKKTEDLSMLPKV